MSTGRDQGRWLSVPGLGEACGRGVEQQNRPEDVNFVVFEIRTDLAPMRQLCAVSRSCGRWIQAKAGQKERGRRGLPRNPDGKECGRPLVRYADARA